MESEVYIPVFCKREKLQQIEKVSTRVGSIFFWLFALNTFSALIIIMHKNNIHTLIDHYLKYFGRVTCRLVTDILCHLHSDDVTICSLHSNIVLL